MGIIISMASGGRKADHIILAMEKIEVTHQIIAM
jgi:hypothetical protein